MSNSQITEFFDVLARVLLRCWLFGFILLFIWLVAFLLAQPMIHVIHGGMFGLTEHELDVIFYCGAGLLKLLILILFFFPWLAIRLTLSRASRITDPVTR